MYKLNLGAGPDKLCELLEKVRKVGGTVSGRGSCITLQKSGDEWRGGFFHPILFSDYGAMAKGDSLAAVLEELCNAPRKYTGRAAAVIPLTKEDIERAEHILTVTKDRAGLVQ
jgi:hypothetical protein